MQLSKHAILCLAGSLTWSVTAGFVVGPNRQRSSFGLVTTSRSFSAVFSEATDDAVASPPVEAIAETSSVEADASEQKFTIYVSNVPFSK